MGECLLIMGWGMFIIYGLGIHGGVFVNYGLWDSWGVFVNYGLGIHGGVFVNYGLGDSWGSVH